MHSLRSFSRFLRSFSHFLCSPSLPLVPSKLSKSRRRSWVTLAASKSAFNLFLYSWKCSSWSGGAWALITFRISEENRIYGCGTVSTHLLRMAFPVALEPTGASYFRLRLVSTSEPTFSRKERHTLSCPQCWAPDTGPCTVVSAEIDSQLKKIDVNLTSTRQGPLGPSPGGIIFPFGSCCAGEINGCGIWRFFLFFWDSSLSFLGWLEKMRLLWE